MTFKPVYLTRQLDILPLNKLGQHITVIGAGAIGSHSVLSLARMGFSNITVYDFDEVSEENMNNQGYYLKHIGRSKVECLAEMVKEAIGFDITIKHEPYTNQPLSGIVISAVDSMKVRKIIWDNGQGATHFIDPRMGAEYAKLYVMQRHDSKDITAYNKTLYTDDEAIRESCTAKSTIYCASLLSGLVVNAVKDIVLGKSYTRVLNWDMKNNSFKQFLKE